MHAHEGPHNDAELATPRSGPAGPVAGPGTPVAALLHLQRCAGNCAVSSLMEPETDAQRSVQRHSVQRDAPVPTDAGSAGGASTLHEVVTGALKGRLQLGDQPA